MSRRPCDRRGSWAGVPFGDADFPGARVVTGAQELLPRVVVVSRKRQSRAKEHRDHRDRKTESS